MLAYQPGSKKKWLSQVSGLLQRFLGQQPRRQAWLAQRQKKRHLEYVRSPHGPRWHIGDIQAMTDREFQAVIAALFRWLGYAVMRTPLSRDAGMDLVLAGQEGKAIVQCKRWRHPVGPAVVREFYGTMVSEEAAQGYLITTGMFSKESRRWARDKDIVLVDGPFLKKMMAEI